MKQSLLNAAKVASIFTALVCAATLGILVILSATGADESVVISKVAGFVGLGTGSAAASISMLAGLSIALVVTTCLSTRLNAKEEFDSFITVMMRTTALLSAIVSLAGKGNLIPAIAFPTTAVLVCIAILRKVVSGVNSGLAFLAGNRTQYETPAFRAVVKFFGLLFLSGTALVGIQAIPMVIAVRNGTNPTFAGSVGYVIALCGALAITCKVCEEEEYEPIKAFFFGFSMTVCGCLALYGPMVLRLLGLRTPVFAEILAAYSIAAAIIGFVRMLVKNDARRAQMFSEASAWSNAWQGLCRKSRDFASGLMSSAGPSSVPCLPVW